MIHLRLNNDNRVALVDEEDYEHLRNYKWNVGCKNQPGRETIWRSYSRGGGVTVIVTLACEIMRIRNVMFDHKNGNPFDNRKENIRECSFSQNAHNRHKGAGYTSMHKGVYWREDSKKWRAAITLNGKRKNLGNFDSEIDAALAYNIEASKLHKEFAVLNKV